MTVAIKGHHHLQGGGGGDLFFTGAHICAGQLDVRMSEMFHFIQHVKHLSWWHRVHDEDDNDGDGEEDDDGGGGSDWCCGESTADFSHGRLGVDRRRRRIDCLQSAAPVRNHISHHRGGGAVMMDT